MKILFLSAWFPYPPINGAKIRIYNLIRQLAAQHEITLLALSRTIPFEKITEYTVELEKYCRIVKAVRVDEFRPQGLSAFKGLFSMKPRSIVQTYSTEMARVVINALRSDSFDLVVASEVSAPSLISLLASQITGIPKVLDALEISLAKDAYEKAAGVGSKARHALTWLKLQTFTRDMLLKCNACTVPSIAEKQNIQELLPRDYPIEVIPHSLDLDLYPESKVVIEPNSLVFTGSFTYHPNLDAARYFIDEIYPAIRAHEPNAKLKIIGNLNGSDPTQFPADQAITCTGLLQDVRPEIAKSWLSIVPLLEGSGTRLKIIESMALGTPVVSTSKGAEGLEVSHGENILIADTPAEFSRAVLDVLHSPSLRQKLSQGGRTLVARNYSAHQMGERFNEFIECLVHKDKRHSLYLHPLANR
jgi:glycosyltransferase involved in cell wall biosynthesis